jgi:hypothetical protein
MRLMLEYAGVCWRMLTYAQFRAEFNTDSGIFLTIHLGVLKGK